MPDESADAQGPDLARAALDAARRAGRNRAARPSRRAGGAGGARGAGSRRSGFTGPGADDRDPQPFGKLIDRLIEDNGWQETAADAAVMGRWDQLVGAEIAAHCRPESLRDGELVVVAESTAWATQLRLLAPRMIKVLSGELGADVVRRIRVHGPTAPSWRKGPRHIRGRGPRDTYG